MAKHLVTVHPESDNLPREEQLAWKMAQVAADPAAIEPEVTEMVINRIMDNAAVAMASVNRGPVITARTQALARPLANGATVYGVPSRERFSADWAAWANAPQPM